MALTAADGAKIRESYSGEKELSICARHGLTQVGGSRTKVDGENETTKASIKNASGSSTQVHLTTQAHFIETMGLNETCATFVRQFCGSVDMDVNGKDRMTPAEIDDEVCEEFVNWMNDNKEKVVDLIIRNGFGINLVIYNDIKNDVEYSLTYDEICDKIKDSSWVLSRGGVHLKSNGKTLFHFQREGKRNPRNRYNTLWHIHRNLFQ